MLFFLVTSAHLERECILENITAKVYPQALYVKVIVKKYVVLNLQERQCVYSDMILSVEYI